MNFSKKRFVGSIFLLILFLGTFIRLYNSNKYFFFDDDQAADMLLLKGIHETLRKGEFSNLSLKGEPVTNRLFRFDKSKPSPVYHGVFYYYFLLPVAIISSFHPYGLTLFFIFAGLASIYLIYLMGKLLFNERVGVLSAFLMAISYWMTSFSRSIWTPSLIPFFALLAYVSFLKILKGATNFWPLFAFSVAAASQMHNSGYVFLLSMLLSLIIFKPKFSTATEKILTFFAFLIPVFPTLVYEIKTRFFLFRLIITAFIHGLGGGGRGVIEISRSIFEEFINYFFVVLGRVVHVETIAEYYRKFILVLLIFLFFGIVLLIIEKRGVLDTKKIVNRIKTPLFIWVLMFIPVPWIAKTYYGNSVEFGNSLIGLLAGIPLIFVSISAAILYLWHKNIFFKASVIFFILAISTANLLAVNRFLWRNEGGPYNYQDKLNAVKLIAKDARGEPFEVNYQWNKSTVEIIYLFYIEGLPLPEFFNGKAMADLPPAYLPWGDWGVKENPNIVLGQGPSNLIYTIRNKESVENLKEKEKFGEKIGESGLLEVRRMRVN